MPNVHLTLDQYAAALRQAGGNRAAAAKILGCPLSTVHSIVRFHPDLRALCEPGSGGPPERYRPEQVIAALRQAGGNQAQAARLLGCWKQTVEGYIKRYPEVRAALDAFPSRPYGPEQIIAALRQAGGHRGKAAGLLGITRGTLHTYFKRYPAARKVRDALDRARRKGPPQPVSRLYAERYSPGKVAEALRQAAGIKAEAARRLGCTRATVDAYIKRHPEVREAWIDARETMVDLAQSKLHEAVERGEWPAVQYTLSTLGKDRGFTTRSTPAPAEPDDKCEQCRAQFLADAIKVYGQADQEQEA